MPEISQRAKHMPASPIRKHKPLEDRVRESRIEVYKLEIGQPDIPSPTQFIDAIRAFQGDVIGYRPSKGDDELREAQSFYYKRHNADIAPDDILVTNGGSEALLLAMATVCDPGQELFAIEPLYSNYIGFATMLGIQLRPFTAHLEEEFSIDGLESWLEKNHDQNLKGGIINYPNNPQGKILRQEEIDMLGKVAKEYNIFLILDGAYREFVFDGLAGKVTDLDLLLDIPEYVIVIDTLSKHYSLTGSRIGSLASKNHHVMEATLKMAQARLSVPTLEQIGATAIISENDAFVHESALEYQRRRDAAYEILSGVPGVHCYKPQGSIYLWVRFDGVDTEDFTRFMLEKFNHEGKTTRIAPGPGFYVTPGMGKDQARIAFVLNVNAMKEALNVLGKGLEAYRK